MPKLKITLCYRIRVFKDHTKPVEPTEDQCDETRISKFFFRNTTGELSSMKCPKLSHKLISNLILNESICKQLTVGKQVFILIINVMYVLESRLICTETCILNTLQWFIQWFIYTLKRVDVY